MTTMSVLSVTCNAGAGVELSRGLLVLIARFILQRLPRRSDRGTTIPEGDLWRPWRIPHGASDPSLPTRSTEYGLRVAKEALFTPVRWDQALLPFPSSGVWVTIMGARLTSWPFSRRWRTR